MKSSEVDLTIKKIFKYILIFVLLCIFTYSLSSGMIVVNAKTYTIDKDFYVGSSVMFTEDKSYPQDIAKKFGTSFKFKTSTQTDKSETFNLISFAFAFKDLDDPSTISSNYLGYYSLHFKYYYDVMKANNFSFFKFATEDNSFSSYLRDFSIYDYQLYTSIDDNGKYSYDEFVILKDIRPHVTLLNNSWSDYDLEYSNMAHFYSYSTLGLKVPNLDSTYELYDAILTDDGTLPISIEEYTSNSDTDYYDPEFMPYEDYDDDDGFFSKLFDSIATGFGSSIGSGTGLWSKINVFLKKLFVPSSPFFKMKYTEMEVLFNQKFGIFTAPINIFINFIEKFLTLSSENTSNFVIKVPEYTVPGFNTPILKATTYDLSNVLNHGTINKLWILYLDFVDCFLIISFLNLSWNKLSSFLGGMTSDNTYYSVDDIDTYDKSTGELISSRQRVRTTQQNKRRNY